MMPTTSDSPITWLMMRRLSQPSALRVPNSRARRATAAGVRSAATVKAAPRVRMANHMPSSLARVAVLASDAVTWLASELSLVIVADGRRLEISPCTDERSVELAVAT
jgi:hypothetical protein